jgi:hypothetical protein
MSSPNGCKGLVAALWADQKTHRVFPPKRNACRKTQRRQSPHRPVPAPAGAKRPPLAGRALAGGLGPPTCTWQASSQGKGNGLRHFMRKHPTLWADEKTPRVFPPKRSARRKTQRRQSPHRPVPAPAGEKRPPMAGRALAGGFGPPTGAWRAWSPGEGNGLRQSSRRAAKGSKPPFGRNRKPSAPSPAPDRAPKRKRPPRRTAVLQR